MKEKTPGYTFAPAHPHFAELDSRGLSEMWHERFTGGFNRVKSKTTSVDKWQQGRPQWNYNPALQFWWRFVQCTVADAMETEYPAGPLRPGESWPIDACRPSNEALLARDWIATSTPAGVFNGKRKFVSFDECCFWLGCNADAERVGLLALIDAGQDFDTTESWERLEVLRDGEPEDTEALFELPDMFRVVPVRDQLTIEWAA